MKPIKAFIEENGGVYRCAESFGLYPTTFIGWIERGAIIDENNQVWLKSTARPLTLKLDTGEDL